MAEHEKKDTASKYTVNENTRLKRATVLNSSDRRPFRHEGVIDTLMKCSGSIIKKTYAQARL